ncbi:hypothetical protein CBF31_07135 [Vagococcus fessus]|uniref:Uncharacterized protein n=1 Tax=Vagococcus fessus TaxID=120370 RepID=A0A430A8T8_9ENTE|nr:hypothetical protein CBF31_07135 [Vagococcus fessus]
MKVFFHNGTSFSAGILPSILIVFLLLSLVLLKMMTVYKDESEMFRQVTYYYEGKVLEELTIKQLLEGKPKDKEGVYIYNLGTVAYRVLPKEVEFDIVLTSGMSYTLIEKR